MATAAFAAASLAGHLGGIGHTSGLEGLRHIAADLISDGAEDILSLHETGDAGVSLAGVLEIGETLDLGRRGLLARVLHLVERATCGDHVSVDGNRFFVGQESLGLLAGVLHIGIGDDGLAKLLNFSFDGGSFLGCCDHKGAEGSQKMGFRFHYF